MILEAGVVVALLAGGYEVVTNSSFRAKVKADALALEAKVPGFVSKVKSAVATLEADVKSKL